MPEKSGVKLFRELQEDPDLGGIPVIIITGISQDFERFIKSRKQVQPPAGYLAKPITEDELIGMVRRLLTSDSQGETS